MAAMNKNTAPHSGAEVFNRDASEGGGYVYTTDPRLSSRLARQRSEEAVLEMGRFAGRRVLDLGCGDAFYTIHFFDHGKPKTMIAVDAAIAAVRVADKNRETRAIRFMVGDAHRLPFPDDAFDLVLIQSILHHDDDPLGIIREGFRLAPNILIHEPNGNNPGLKVIERLSPYHRKHGEKSYTSRQLVRWVEQAGGVVLEQRFAGFVPMFCSDPLAGIMKRLEPLVERSGLAAIGCAVYLLVGTRK